MNSERTSPPGRVQMFVARTLRRITLPLVVAVVGAVVLISVTAVLAGSLGSP